MRLIARHGVWCAGEPAAPAPLVAVLEVSGAVLSWTVDADTGPHIAFTDPARADWLWRVVGVDGHRALADALAEPVSDDGAAVEAPAAQLLPGALDHLRRLAFGHWLRRWWPASHRDGIAELDQALVAAEIAALTDDAQDFFDDDALDDAVDELLEPHLAALDAHALRGDPRVQAVVARARELAELQGVEVRGGGPAAVRSDYALAAGLGGGRAAAGEVAGGVASIAWSAVPPGIFDAAEDTVAWRVEADGDGTRAVVRVELVGPDTPEGIGVRLRAAGVAGAGALEADGRSVFALADADRRPLTETDAWGRDWRGAAVAVGAAVDEPAGHRERVRELARSRLRRPPADALLAEVLAAESDY
ncbi:hypothetical protein [Mycolicibacterium brumae]|uniref:Uncharacterized protein n=1 Tax=Mycolicibacterium brumae TaxID=85968 RepID=A0A2G5P5A8_9MYCO|nr:hypothetical protein [Mycolicibacterium brumae]MCV7194552.1 hypothetical protein [Mycolicibacterium brumae]PIB73447.1 hypothetical protein CQY22_016860 [Mycolicibacterium brumae]UWW08892.1 hypothetical protein L2Z93_001968 [Mycolicibacterium brumae]